MTVKHNVKAHRKGRILFFSKYSNKVMRKIEIQGNYKSKKKQENKQLHTIIIHNQMYLEMEVRWVVVL